MISDEFVELVQSLLVRMNQLEIHMRYIRRRREVVEKSDVPSLDEKDTAARINDIHGFISPFGIVCYSDDGEWFLVRKNNDGMYDITKDGFRHRRLPDGKVVL